MSKKIDDLKAKIAALQTKLAEAVLAEKNTITADKIAHGDIIGFKLGKGDAAVPATGKVLGVVVPEGKGGSMVRILTGEGIDTRVVSVFLSAVTSVPEKAEQQAE